MPKDQPGLDMSPPVSDEVRRTTCYMCACRCGINVHMKAGKVAYIEGNATTRSNKGCFAPSGSAGFMRSIARSRLRAPCGASGPRGSGNSRNITWDADVTSPFLEISAVATGAEKIRFFTARPSRKSLSGLLGPGGLRTPKLTRPPHARFVARVNYGGGGILHMGGAFWEFVPAGLGTDEICFLLFACEDNDQNRSRRGSAVKAARRAHGRHQPDPHGYNAGAERVGRDQRRHRWVALMLPDSMK